MKNKYIRRSKLSEAKFRELLRCFCLDLDAGQIAAIIRLNRNTVNRYLRLIRQRVADLCEKSSPFGSREIFEAVLSGCRILRLSGKRTSSKNAPPVFGATNRRGHVFTEILPQPFQSFLKASLSRGSSLADCAPTFRCRGYRMLMYFGCPKPYSLIHDRPFSFVSQEARTEPLWLFWLYARKRLFKFQGIPRSTFALHLKECEFRYNSRGRDIYGMLLKEFRKRPIERGGADLGDDGEESAFVPQAGKGRARIYEDALQDFPEEALRSFSEA